jgi:hypothetical protein
LKIIVAYSRLLLLGVWLGAAIFFGAAVAPAVFGVLRGAQLANAGELAGTMVSRLLSIINRGGFEVALFLLVTGYFINKRGSRPARYAEAIALLIMAAMTGVSQWVISARMLALRAAMQAPIDQIALGEPRRAAFDALHGYSVGAMGVAVIAALLSFVLMSIQARAASMSRPTRHS